MKNVMQHKHGGVIILTAIAALAVATFLVYRNNRKRYATNIKSMQASTQPLAWLATLDAGYLKAWSNGLDAGQKTFVYNGKQYSTQGGKAV